MLSLQSGKLLSGDWWSPEVSGRSKRSTASTPWGWTLLSEWPCIPTGSQPEPNSPGGIDRQYPPAQRKALARLASVFDIQADEASTQFNHSHTPGDCGAGGLIRAR